ncbi:MAG: DNA-binding domain-containing protein [Candidatus Thiodiazotropha sp.]
MNNLEALQSRFQNYILTPASSAEISWVGGGGRASPQFQLSVYANAYLSRLKEVLMSDYPALSVAISSDLFEHLAEGYIHHHPSHFFSLREYGRNLPAYVDGLVQSDPRYRDLAWLPELASFEWTLGQAFDAAESGFVSEGDMASVPAERWPLLRFSFSPCVRRIDLEWNVPAMWKALTADPPLEVEAVRCGSSSAWLIWRQELVTRFRSLELDEQLLLDALRSGATFNDACEMLAERIEADGVPMRAAGLLKGWIQQGLITRLMFSD